MFYSCLTLYHIPSSWMTIMVRVVEGCQHSAHIRCSNHRDGVSRPQKWPILVLQEQRGTWQCITASKVQIGRIVDSLLYIEQASYIYVQDYVRQEIWPAILVRESKVFTGYIRFWYSTYLPIFKSQKGSIQALNFFIITHVPHRVHHDFIINYTNYLIITEK